MSISFNDVPSNLRIPFLSVEFDPSQAQQGPALLQYQGLMIGQKLAAGSQAADTTVQITNADQAIPLFGQGSMLHRMAIAWFASNKETPLKCGVLADDGAAVAATGTLTITGPATAAGTLALYLAGKRVPVAVADADTATDIGDAVEAAVTADADLPFTASNLAGVVTFTAKNKGPQGNDLDIRTNYLPTDELPAGVTAVVVAMSGGATAPDLTALIAALGDEWFHIIGHPASAPCA
jgi:phage tail sheath gpL-like